MFRRLKKRKKRIQQARQARADLLRSELAPPERPISVPKHLAIIMDGNGRWAKGRGRPRLEGHRAGARAIRETIKACVRHGVEYLTIYTFSQENWKRPKDEVDGLFVLIEGTLKRELAELAAEGVRIRAVGDLASVPEGTRLAFAEAEAKTATNDKLNLGVALNYGGRGELLHVMRNLAEKVASNEISAGDIDESLVDGELYTAGFPDPDLIIRTGGDMRLSNFLLWQSAYAELWYTPTLWPEFGEKELLSAFAELARRERRFGGLT